MIIPRRRTAFLALIVWLMLASGVHAQKIVEAKTALDRMHEIATRSGIGPTSDRATLLSWCQDLKTQVEIFMVKTQDSGMGLDPSDPERPKFQQLRDEAVRKGADLMNLVKAFEEKVQNSREITASDVTGIVRAKEEVADNFIHGHKCHGWLTVKYGGTQSEMESWRSHKASKDSELRDVVGRIADCTDRMERAKESEVRVDKEVESLEKEIVELTAIHNTAQQTALAKREAFARAHKSLLESQRTLKEFRDSRDSKDSSDESRVDDLLQAMKRAAGEVDGAFREWNDMEMRVREAYERLMNKWSQTYQAYVRLKEAQQNSILSASEYTALRSKQLEIETSMVQIDTMLDRMKRYWEGYKRELGK